MRRRERPGSGGEGKFAARAWEEREAVRRRAREGRRAGVVRGGTERERDAGRRCTGVREKDEAEDGEEVEEEEEEE